MPGGGRIVFAGDLYVKGWQLYKQGQTTAPLPSAGESPQRRNAAGGKISMCNVSIFYIYITIIIIVVTVSTGLRRDDRQMGREASPVLDRNTK